jgi:hypothetical protein
MNSWSQVVARRAGVEARLWLWLRNISMVAKTRSVVWLGSVTSDAIVRHDELLARIASPKSAICFQWMMLSLWATLVFVWEGTHLWGYVSVSQQNFQISPIVVYSSRLRWSDDVDSAVQDQQTWLRLAAGRGLDYAGSADIFAAGSGALTRHGLFSCPRSADMVAAGSGTCRWTKRRWQNSSRRSYV